MQEVLEILQKKLQNRTSPLRIGIDLDGVVIDHTQAFLCACGEFGYHLESWQVNSNMLKHFLPKEIHTSIKRLVYTERRLEASPMQGSLEAVLALLAPSFDLIIASVQKEEEAEERLWTWLGTCGFSEHIPKDRVHIFRSREEKVSYLQGLDLDFFIDDGTDVLEPLIGKTAPILFDPAEIHKRISIPEGIYVVEGWHEIREIFGASTQ